MAGDRGVVRVDPGCTAIEVDVGLLDVTGCFIVIFIDLIDVRALWIESLRVDITFTDTISTVSDPTTMYASNPRLHRKCNQDKEA